MSENWSQLDGGRFLADLFQKDSIQGNFLQKIITAINKLGSTVGANPVGEVQPPPPINNINIKTSGELMQVTLNHNVPISRNCNYFVEVANEPNFKQPIVHQLGVSRSSPPISLPTFDDAGTKQNYYVQAYAQYPGSKPSKITRFGGLLNPASVQMGGATEMSLLPSTGSGTASPTGQQGGSGFGKVLNSATVQGPIQSSIAPAITQANTNPSSGLVGSLLMPSIFSVGGASPLTGEPSGGAIDVGLVPEAASTFFAGPLPSSLPPEVPVAGGTSGTSRTTYTADGVVDTWIFLVMSDQPLEAFTPASGWTSITTGGNGALQQQVLKASAAPVGSFASSTNWASVFACFNISGGAPTFVYQNEATIATSNTKSYTPATNVTAGNGILLYIMLNGNANIAAPYGISVVDTQGNTYYSLGIQTLDIPGGNNACAAIFYAPSVVGGANTLTLTFTGMKPTDFASGTLGYIEVTPFVSITGAVPTFRIIENIDLVNAIFGPSGPTHQAGAVPDPGATAGTTRFLREDATWDVPTSSVKLVQAQVTFSNADAPDGQDTTAQVVVTGQSWVTTGSIIVATVAGGTTNHPDPDEPAVEAVTVAVGNLVAGTGFTVSAYAPRGTWGTYYVNCIGM